MSTVQTKAPRGPVPARRGAGPNWVDLVQDLGLMLVLLAGGAAMTFASPVFFSRINIENLLFSSTIIAVMAIGQTFVILLAGIDLSVGAVMALASVLAVGLPLHFGVPVGVAALVALAVGGLLGLVNGLNVTVVKIPALIATLAMLTVARGVAFIYSGGQNIAPVPDVYVDVQAARVFGFPLIILLTGLLAVLAHVVLARTRFGRAVYATGGNPVASRLAGIRTTRVVLIAYVISGLVHRFGAVRVMAFGGLCAGAGLALSVVSPTWEGGVLGYALVGAGCSNIVPVLYSATGRQTAMPEHTAVPAVTTLGYAGILCGPAGIGLLAQLTSLQTAFLAMAIMLLAVSASAGALRRFVG